MNKWLKVLLLAAALLAVLSFFRDQLIKSAIMAAAKNTAGVEVTIKGFSMSLFGQSALLTGIKVFNPPGFPGDPVMLDIPEVAVSVDIPALLKYTLHVPFLRIDLKEARVVTDRQRHKNVEALTFAGKASSPREEASASAPAPTVAPPEKQHMKIKFDRVVLSVGTVMMDDYSSGKDHPRRMVMTLNMKNKELRNITGPADLGGAVMREVLQSTGLGTLFSTGKSAADKAATGVLDLFGGILK